MSVDFPVSAAMDKLSGFELIGIEAHYARRFDHLGLGQTVCGLVWAFENRAVKVPWADIEQRTVGDLQNYFADEPTDTDPDEPDSNTGKDSSPIG